VSAAPHLLAGLIWVFAAPPTEEADPEASPEEVDEAKKTEFEPPPEAVDKDLPRDERNDPILPYGETQPDAELEYADETPPPPEMEYAEDTPPPPEMEYDQSRQRLPPEDEALDRQSDLEDDPGKEKFQGRVESPQRFLVELKFGPYLPNVDTRWEGSGFGPYATIYGRTDENGVTIGEPKKGVFSVVSFEWQFYHAAGPLSIGTTFGWFRDKADALIAEPVMDGETTRSSADKTVFNVVPLTLLLGYRFELLADRFRVPLVPYARGGVAYGFWVEKKGGQLATNNAGAKSRGGSWGWQANLGLMLRLDFIERAAAVDLDRLTGINHTYIFGEWQFSHLNGFGTGKAMSVGDDTFLIGLAVEF
jgi:hypothetical protein